MNRLYGISTSLRDKIYYVTSRAERNRRRKLNKTRDHLGKDYVTLNNYRQHRWFFCEPFANGIYHEKNNYKLDAVYLKLLLYWLKHAKRIYRLRSRSTIRWCVIFSWRAGVNTTLCSAWIHKSDKSVIWLKLYTFYFEIVSNWALIRKFYGLHSYVLEEKILDYLLVFV